MSVVIVGSVNQDVVARVDRIPGPGETVLGSSLSRSGGGKGANQAVAARRAGGADVAFVGAVGTDADGAILRASLERDGIDVSGLAEVTGPSGTALIAVDELAENTVVVVPGANAALARLTDVQRIVVERSRVLLTQLEVPVSLVRDAAAARPDGAWHVHNAAPSAPFVVAAEDLLPGIDVLIVNEHEALEIAEVADRDAAVAALAARVPALVVTLGRHGSLVVVGEEKVPVPAYTAHAVDTTGAGDTFCGVFAARLAASGRHPEDADATLLADAARWGAAASAISVTRPGAQDAVPHATEVARLRQESE
ncbi:PfkB family carbohydrate kinase [Microbacterium sp. NPDC058345]|uniref:PfkB family carbohydrate kinase n=1 Tax=Microbacterium sp. NPDC058345 TaxID=3346455 RepID=UPI00365A7453